MRITSFMIYDQLTRSLQRNLEDLADLHARLSSGKKINKPSDDVIGLMRSLDYRVSINANDQYRRNIDEGEAQLGFIDAAMTSLSKAIDRAKGLAVSGAGGTLDADVRATLAQDALQVRNTLLNLGNSRFRDRYVFSGFRTDQPAFNPATFGYQGDAGLINAPIDRTATIPVNVPGSSAFAYTLPAPQVTTISGGRFAHYTPGAGTTVQVEIRDTDDTTVLDTFSFSNVIEAVDILSTALAADDVTRSEALVGVLGSFQDQAVTVQAEVGVRLAQLGNQRDRLSAVTLTLQQALSSVEDADTARTATELNKVETALEALLKSSSRILSQSLLDFLR